VLDEGPGVRTDRVIISLSRGGADAVVAREFDLERKAFVPAAELAELVAAEAVESDGPPPESLAGLVV